MTETNCDVCLTDPSLSYVSISNTKLNPVNLKIETIDHNSLYACLETDPSAKLEGSTFSTCLTERDPCSNPALVVKQLNMAGKWNVELEDGTLIENKTIEELADILLEYDLLVEIPLKIEFDCLQYEVLPSTFKSTNDLNYEENSRWDLYIDGELYGSTGNGITYMEDLIDTHPYLKGTWNDGILVENMRSTPISIAFVSPKNFTDDFVFNLEMDYESYEFNRESGIIQFCLGGES